MSRKLAVVLSDVHIGDGSRTCWYQPHLHEPYLLQVLNWTYCYQQQIEEVILLGDLLDYWTYPPSSRPPTTADIVAANPNIFGPNTPLAWLVKEMPGRVGILAGNHDGALGQADVDVLSTALGGTLRLLDPVHVVAGNSGKSTVFAHGHHWTLFNAPDDHSPWGGLPVGHFVTRMVAHQVATRLKPGQTAADLHGMGAPGMELSDLEDLLKVDTPITDLLLDRMASKTGLPHDYPIVLADGSTTTLDEVKRVYSGLYARWAAAEGSWNAYRAALADNFGEFLAWFAQRLAMRNGCDLAVLGHTHGPVGGLIETPVGYVNSGFQCPPRPDMPGAQFTFTVVDLDHASAQVMRVVPDGDHYDSQPAAAPRIPVTPRRAGSVPLPTMDFSSYVRITNAGSSRLELRSLPKPVDGVWVVPPPRVLDPGQRADAWLQDVSGPRGSEGSFIYSSVGGTPITVSVACPTAHFNSFSSSAGHWVARSGDGDWGDEGSAPWTGHPLQVRLTLG